MGDYLGKARTKELLQKIKTWVLSIVPTKTSDLTNDSGYIASETDPTVQGYAKVGSGITVAKSVPSDAKFTDTVYDDTALSSRVGAIENRTNGDGNYAWLEINRNIATSKKGTRLFLSDADHSAYMQLWKEDGTVEWNKRLTTIDDLNARVGSWTDGGQNYKALDSSANNILTRLQVGSDGSVRVYQRNENNVWSVLADIVKMQKSINQYDKQGYRDGDLNTFTEGFRVYKINPNACTNVPVAGLYGHLVVFQPNGESYWAVQVFFGEDLHTYTRFQNGGAWTNWVMDLNANDYSIIESKINARASAQQVSYGYRYEIKMDENTKLVIDAETNNKFFNISCVVNGSVLFNKTL